MVRKKKDGTLIVVILVIVVLAFSSTQLTKSSPTETVVTDGGEISELSEILELYPEGNLFFTIIDIQEDPDEPGTWCCDSTCTHSRVGGTAEDAIDYCVSKGYNTRQASCTTEKWVCNEYDWHAYCEYDYCCPPEYPKPIPGGTISDYACGCYDEESNCPSGLHCDNCGDFIDCEYGVCCPYPNIYYCPDDGNCYSTPDCGDVDLGTIKCEDNNLFKSVLQWGCWSCGLCDGENNGPGTCPGNYPSDYCWCEHAVWNNDPIVYDLKDVVYYTGCDSCQNNLCQKDDECSEGDIKCETDKIYMKCAEIDHPYFSAPFMGYSRVVLFDVPPGYKCEYGELIECNTVADIDCDGIVTRDELGKAIVMWINYEITRDQLGEAIEAWQS